jgi:hypothetical protein
VMMCGSRVCLAELADSVKTVGNYSWCYFFSCQQVLTLHGSI